MFDQSCLNDVLAAYEQWLEHEKYKWEAIKWFQDKWDDNAPDFAKMLMISL